MKNVFDSTTAHGNKNEGNHEFHFISGQSLQNKAWQRTTSAMNVPGGCLVLVETLQNTNTANSTTFLAGVEVVQKFSADGKGLGYELKPISVATETNTKTKA